MPASRTPAPAAEHETLPIEVSAGVDIGGTFTDVVVVATNHDRPQISWTKVPSTPAAPVHGVLAGIRRGLSQMSLDGAQVDHVMHGTTVGTNAVLEQKGAKVALLTTEGFEDVLEVGRQRRSQLYVVTLEAETPVFLCPRRRRLGVRERIASDGSTLIPLDEAQVLELLDTLTTLDIESIAVCYLFSFVNPTHEQSTQELIKRTAPNMSVSLSHLVNPVFREYERTCVTLFDAYLRPVIEGYLTELVLELGRAGVGAHRLQTMQSRGGLASTEAAIARPVTTVLSGPAAGVIGAKWIAKLASTSDIVSLDMGGTSTDIALVTEGAPMTATRQKIGRYPLNIPAIDVQTIGAGGGSIAWIDEAGGLRVGPESAGADPGPACYGLGGDQPTVTDASLVLGYLDPERPLGGRHRLSLDAATEALDRLGRRLRMSPVELALGIHRIANAKMADAIRLASVKRGYDLRNFTLVAFGGAGPVHGVFLASELGLQRCLIPTAPGVVSALGLLASNVEYDHTQTYVAPLDRVDPADAFRTLEHLSRSGADQMSSDGYDPAECTTHFSADLRFVGQSTELEVSLSGIDFNDFAASVRLRFEAEHERVYGYAPPETPIEFINLRSLWIRPPTLDLQGALEAHLTTPSDGPQQTRRRRCVFPTGTTNTPVLTRSELSPQQSLLGPLIIQQEDTTVVLYPGTTAVVDSLGNLVVSAA
jgi:N-methylhydantoinase A